MKAFVGILLLVGVVAAAKQKLDVCHATVEDGCVGQETNPKCDSLYGGFGVLNAQVHLQKYVNSQLASSYDYLLLASFFNSHQKNRPGFQKLAQRLSDEAWDNAVKLAKHITKRGGTTDLKKKYHTPSVLTAGDRSLEIDELHAMALMLDSEKKLSREAIHAHHALSHVSDNSNYDPEISQFLEEHFLEKQASTIRELSGHTNDLLKIIKDDHPSLGIYLFDEYLQGK